jgi:putative endonuclease
VSAFVYLLRCRDGSLYCGWTDDLARRLSRHNAGTGAAYTRSRRPVALVWHEECDGRGAALSREYAIKRLARSDKLRLVASAGAGAGTARRRRVRTH